jgi:hypothetical protein
MRNIAMIGAAVVLLLTGMGIGQAMSQEGGAEDPAGGEQDWMKLHQPGEEHKALAADAGEYDIEARMWMGEAKDPIVVKGTSKQTMMFDRFLFEEFTIGEGEMEYKGRGYMGYDNSNEEYCCCYFGSGETALHVLTGQRKGDTTELTGQWTEKGMGGITVKQRVVVVNKDKDTTFTTIYGTYGDAPEVKHMELTYKRKK